MEFGKSSFILLSFIMAVSYVATSVESAPNNSTASAPAPLPPKVNATSPVVSAKPAVTLSSNGTKSGNKTSEDSGEDCEPEAEPETSPGAGNGTKTSGQREGKQLPLDKESDKYKTHEGGAAEPEPEAVNEKVGNSTAAKNAHAPGADAEKLQGGNSSSTTVAPHKAGAGNMAPSSLLWANVIFTTLLVSFTYSTL